MSDARRDSLRWLALEHAPLLVLTAIYVGMGFLAERLVGQTDAMDLSFAQESLNTIASLFLIFFFSGHALWMLPRTPEGQSVLSAIWGDLRARFLTPRRVGGFLVVMVVVPVVSSTFFSLKLMLPQLQPFAWDETFYAWDKALHLGVDPWRLLHPLLGNTWATVGLNVAYNAWILLLLGVTVWQALSARRALRFRFLMSFLLMWLLLGSTLATALSSAGPCFYGRVVPGPDPYAPLMSWLHGVQESTGLLWAVETQELLWEAYATGEVVTVAGISAMPSMHVAVATLFALLGWAADRRLGVALGLFLLSIQLGSVHLGWHYAIDGYVSVACVCAIWWAVGQGMRRLGFVPPDEPTPAPPPKLS
ncbi:MAG: phosphatase PAP2 family protein [Alphaproteobacteria bacterium]|nr:phosphatase PAP2 family protein [Alphaproteobacteria bacterium]MCB9793831.1 phosphatase PAP2 family protein [Alphaproteobacteria bacterium]